MQRRRDVEERDRRENEEQEPGRREHERVQLAAVLVRRAADVPVMNDLAECGKAERTSQRAPQQQVGTHVRVIRLKDEDEQDGADDQAPAR
jgi:hypothetical protein